MKRKSISLIVGLMALALLGVMGMQLYFLKQAYALKSQLFDRSVNEALNNVVEKLGKHEANAFLEFKARSKKPVPIRAGKYYRMVEVRDKPTKQTSKPQSYASLLKNEQRKADSIFNLRDSLLKTRYPYVYSFNETLPPVDLEDANYNLQVDVMQYEDAFGQLHQQSVTRTTSSIPFKRIKKVNPLNSDSIRRYIVFDPQTGPKMIMYAKPKLVNIYRPPVEKIPQEKEVVRVKRVKEFFDSVGTEQNKNVFQDLAAEYQQAYVPLSKRIHPLILDSMLRNELHTHTIFSDYFYKVSSAKCDSVIFIRTSNNVEFFPANSYSIPMFPKDMIRDAGVLTVTFPDKNTIILSNMSAMMGLSGGLLLVLIFCFGYTIHSILKQKKISEMKTDFINNMTHEFKTPVSTIMIASEALKDPEIRENRDRIDRLANIIYDENVRLGNHIERVLNIAKIDKGDLKLEFKEVEMNDLLAAVVDSMGLQLEKKEALVNLQLNALRATIKGDELHLSNVIFNLMDNAIKYSKEKPEIDISTSNQGNNLIIKVADRGIGMSKDQSSRIFDQFYRIPTGNLHDVKGFGLGLSYVNTIVKRFNGTIRVRSEKDKGSEFEISLPLI